MLQSKKGENNANRQKSCQFDTKAKHFKALWMSASGITKTTYAEIVEKAHLKVKHLEQQLGGSTIANETPQPIREDCHASTIKKDS